MSERWSSQENVKFVNLYRDQENLWNVFDSQYKNRDARRTSLQHIVTEMNIPRFTEKDVAKKIKNLRSTYNQELLKIEKSKKSGSGTDDMYKPSIKWFDIMDYIMKIINLKEKETSSNLVSIHTILFQYFLIYHIRLPINCSFSSKITFVFISQLLSDCSWSVIYPRTFYIW